MRKYPNTAGSDVRIGYGIDLAEGANSFEKTQDLVPEINEKNEQLETAAAETNKLMYPLARARAVVRVESFHSDKILQRMGAAAQVADGGRRGPVFNYVFEDGVSVAVEPHGMQQLPMLQKVTGKLQATNRPDLKTFADQWLPELNARITTFSKAVDALKTLLEQHDALFATEKARRDEHALMIDKMAGIVRSRFPNDRAQQDAVFPAPRSPGKR
ncbi:MAG: hypothetical protein HUU55_22215 [Myxococcales bacterium]|nr:hypothetical protein [Myxococcales bacterium]